MSTNNVRYVHDTTGGGTFLYRHRLKKLIYPNGQTISHDYNKTPLDYVYNFHDRDVDGNDNPSVRWTVREYNGTRWLAVGHPLVGGGSLPGGSSVQRSRAPMPFPSLKRPRFKPRMEKPSAGKQG